MDKRFYLITILLLLISGMASAQPAGYAGAFSRIGFGPRGLAMGNALSSVTGQGIYGYYNPAHSGWIEGNQVDLGTSLMSFDRTLSTFQVTFALPPEAGMSLTLINARTADFDGRTTSGYHTGTFSTNEYQLLSSFGVQLSEKVSLGAGVKFNIADFHEELSNEAGIGIDLGTLVRITDRLNASVTVRDLLSLYSWNAAQLYGGDQLALRNDRFPVRLEGELSYVVPGNWTISANYGRLIHPDEQFNQLKAGASYRIHEHFSLRAGVQVDDLNAVSTTTRPGAGFSIHLPFDNLSPSVDYAFLSEPGNVSTMHVFGIRLNL